MFKLPALTLVTVASLTLINPGAARALDVTNRDFDIDLSGWETTGQTRGLDSQAFLETCYFDDAGGGCNEDIRLTDFTELQAFLATLPNNLNIKEGSAIKQEITANAGEILTFSWNFLTNEEPSECLTVGELLSHHHPPLPNKEHLLEYETVK